MNKLVAISDAHLGQCGTERDNFGQYSLLSTRSRINLVREFAAAVAEYAGDDKVTLLVAGDLLDLSLAYIEDALTDLRELLKELKIDEIVYVVGNHDIEMWSLHCEDKHLLGALHAGEVPPVNSSNPNSRGIYKITPRKGEPFQLLQPLVDRIYGPNDPGRVPIKIAYPSYAIEFPNGTLAYFCHGNLLGGIYTKISDILHDELQTRPFERVTATVNQPLIGLIYWLLGEMGEGMGIDGLIERVYTDIEKGDGKETEKLIRQAAAAVFRGGVVRGIPDRLERWAITKLAMRRLRSQLPEPGTSGGAKERYAEIAQTEEDLWRWVEQVPLLNDRKADLEHATHVIIGHTHVQDRHLYEGTKFTGWNLGGWLIEPNHSAPRTGFLGFDVEGNASWVDVA